MLERFVAGIVVIGLLLWGASILATPGDERSSEPDAPDAGPGSHGTILPRLDEPVEPESTGDDDDEDADRDGDSDASSTDRKGKNKGPD